MRYSRFRDRRGERVGGADLAFGQRHREFDAWLSRDFADHRETRCRSAGAAGVEALEHRAGGDVDLPDLAREEARGPERCAVGVETEGKQFCAPGFIGLDDFPCGVKQHNAIGTGDQLTAVREDAMRIARCRQFSREVRQLFFCAGVIRFDGRALTRVAKGALIGSEIHPIGAARFRGRREARQDFSTCIQLEHFFRSVRLADEYVVRSIDGATLRVRVEARAKRIAQQVPRAVELAQRLREKECCVDVVRGVEAHAATREFGETGDQRVLQSAA